MMATMSPVWSASVLLTTARLSMRLPSSAARPPKPTAPVWMRVERSLVATPASTLTSSSATNSSSGASVALVTSLPSTRISAPEGSWGARSSTNFSPSSDVVRSTASESDGSWSPSLTLIVTRAR